MVIKNVSTARSDIDAAGDGFKKNRAEKENQHCLAGGGWLKDAGAVNCPNHERVLAACPDGEPVSVERFRRRDADGCGRDDRAPRKVTNDRGEL